MSVGMPGYNATASDVNAASSGKAIVASDSSDVTTEQTTVMTASDTALPEKVAYVPISKPGAAFPLTTPAAAETIVGNTPQSLTQQAQTAQQTDAVAQQIAAADGDVAAPKPAAAPAMNNPVYVTAGETPQAEAPKKKGFLASMFGATPASATPAPLIGNARTGEQPPAQAKAAPAAAKPIITLASANSTAKPVQLASLGGDTGGHITGSDALPGVRQTALFEIKRKSGLDDESDVDLNEDEGPVGGSYQVASAAGMARLAPNGLLKQNESVDVACLKPSLVRVLKTIEGHYGRKMTVTSGYRDPARNRRANGAKNSLHMYCAAADIQVPGVSKWELASYIRSMPGRGGVGTYCHTESVHVDVGPERDWNWRCRRRSGGDG